MVSATVIKSLGQFGTSVRLASFVMLLSGCQGQYETVSDAELSRRAQALPLVQRYDFYLDVYNDRYPPRTEVADDVADLGEPAWRYTINRATSGGFAELDSALPVLQAFDRKCSSAEYGLLIKTARKSAPDDGLLRSAVGGVRIACGLVTGTTLKDYDRAYESTPPSR